MAGTSPAMTGPVTPGAHFSGSCSNRKASASLESQLETQRRGRRQASDPRLATWTRARAPFFYVPGPMPKRTDIKTIMIIGAGPIVIGQACEFDYSGTQACKTLKDEGYRVVLVNSNPATIMTDPELADATYIEPITPEIVAKIIEKERNVLPGGFALLPTMGGQTALNCALSLRKMGTLAKFDVEMIGATADAIDKAEDRQLFRNAMEKIGLQTPKSRLANASALKKSYRDKYLAEREKLSGSALEDCERQWVL